MKSPNSTKLILIGITLIIASFILLLGFGLNGQTEISGNYPENIQSVSLRCVSSTLVYPFFTYDNADDRKTTINAIFDGEMINAISLISELYYKDASHISRSFSHNHAAMNKKFAEDGLASDSFSARYTSTDGGIIMSLYAEKNNIDSVSMRYFLASGLNANSSINQFEANYETQGFLCEQVK